MRTFIAIEFNEETKDVIYQYGRQIRNLTAAGDYSYKGNIHLTVKFIGEVLEKDIGLIKRIMDDISIKYSKFYIEFSGLGSFNTGSDNILWIGIKASEPLISLYKTVNAELYIKGFKGDNKPFKPHITLGRRVVFKNGIDEIKNKIKPDIKPVQETGITLMESVRIRGKLMYIPIHKTLFS